MVQSRSSLSPVARLSLAVVTSALLVLGLATRSFAEQMFHICQPVEVAAFASRVHVLCNIGTRDGIRYFAVATANSAHAARILSVLMMAHLTARSIAVLYDPADTSGTNFGCLEEDCRRLLGVKVGG